MPRPDFNSNVWGFSPRNCEHCGNCRYFGFMPGEPWKICKQPDRISVLTQDEFNDGCELWEIVDAHGEKRGRIATLEEVKRELCGETLQSN